MVSEKDAKRIAEKFIEENWCISVAAEKVIFRSAENQRARIEALATNEDDDSVCQMLEKCRDSLSVMFPTVLKDGTTIPDSTFVDVDAHSGIPAFVD